MITLNLESLLQERGRSFYWLAKETGINQTMVSRMRHNKVKLISLEALDRICEVLECEPGELIVRMPNKKARSKKK
jgi:putative transcriptional regulator